MGTTYQEDYDYHKTAHATITDEVYNNSVGVAYYLGDAPRNFLTDTTTFQIWTGAGKTGTRLVENTDFTLSSKNKKLSNATGLEVKNRITLINYGGTDLYHNYDCVASEIGAARTNDLQDQIDAVGGFGWVTKTVTSSTYTVTNSDMISYNEIMFDTTSNSITVTLPDRATQNGKKIKLSHAIQGSTNIVTINRAGSDTISQDALTSIELPEEQNYVELFASSIISAWGILNESITCQLKLNTYSGYGSTDTKIMRFTNSIENVGNMFSENHSTGYSSNTEGLEITINRSGKYAVSFFTRTDAGYTQAGLTLNSSQLTTNFGSTTLATRLGGGMSLDAYNDSVFVSIVMMFKNGDIIRPHTEGEITKNDDIFNVSYIGQ